METCCAIWDASYFVLSLSPDLSASNNKLQNKLNHCLLNRTILPQDSHMKIDFKEEIE